MREIFDGEYKVFREGAEVDEQSILRTNIIEFIFRSNIVNPVPSEFTLPSHNLPCPIVIYPAQL